jgi:pyruvyltransferase
LLTPLVYSPAIEKKYEIGLVLRWSDTEWLGKSVGPGVKLIDLGTSDVEGVLDQMLSCKYIITSSLHGLIIADAYGIPNAWLSSKSPAGFEFKFYDYFLSVDKVRHATEFDIAVNDITVEVLEENFTFDGRKINFDSYALLDACPFLKRKQPS